MARGGKPLSLFGDLGSVHFFLLVGVVFGAEPQAEWSSDRQRRLIVEVDPVQIAAGIGQMVARVKVDFDDYSSTNAI